MTADKFDFYVQAWLKDKALQKCTLNAQGLWINIICLMQKSPIRGKLLNKKSEIIQPIEIPELVNKSKEVVDDALQELIDNKVIKIDELGAFYSKKLLEVNEKKKKGHIDPYQTEAMEFYYEWHKAIFNVKPRIMAVDAKALKDLLAHFATLENDKNNRLELFKIMLQNWSRLDAFLQKCTDLRQINANINKIIVCFQNQNKVNKGSKLDKINEGSEKLNNFDYNTLKKQNS